MLSDFEKSEKKKKCMCRRSELQTFPMQWQRDEKCSWITISRASLYSQTHHTESSVLFFFKNKKMKSMHSRAYEVHCMHISPCIIFRTRHNICFSLYPECISRFVVCHFSPLNELFILHFHSQLHTQHRLDERERKGFWCELDDGEHEILMHWKSEQRDALSEKRGRETTKTSSNSFILMTLQIPHTLTTLSLSRCWWAQWWCIHTPQN